MLALGRAQGMVRKYLKTLPADVSWNKIKAILIQQFSLVPAVTHAATWLMHRNKQKGESLQEFNFKSRELIQAVMNHEPKDVMDPLKI